MKFRDIKPGWDGLRETKSHEWAIRFFFGGLISLVAGYCAGKWGPLIGGLLLGFPSVLPATVTLITKHKGRQEAAEDARGTAIGSLALILFALSSWGALEHGLSLGFSLLLGALIWILGALIFWRIFS